MQRMFRGSPNTPELNRRREQRNQRALELQSQRTHEWKMGVRGINSRTSIENAAPDNDFPEIIKL